MSFLYFDKLLPLLIIILFFFIFSIFTINYYMFLPASMFYMESLVFLRKNTFLNLKFLERHLLFLNNIIIQSFLVYFKRSFLYFYFYRLNFLVLASFLMIIIFLLYLFSLNLKCDTENVKISEVLFSPVVNSMVLFFKSILVSLPRSKSLSLMWNFGSILAIVLAFQIATGLLLVINYRADRTVAFDRVQFIIYEINFGFLFRIFHFNGASLFFIFLFLHLFKGLFHFSYRLHFVWIRGITIFILTMLTAFLGYVLV